MAKVGKVGSGLGAGAAATYPPTLLGTYLDMSLDRYLLT